jgi:hypothetical protein
MAKPTLAELTAAIEIIEIYMTRNATESVAIIKSQNRFSTFVEGIRMVVMGEEYPEDLRARAIKVLAALENTQNN